MRPVDSMFPEAQRVPAVTEGRCVQPPFGCGLPVRSRDFVDEASKREFQISGMCQSCQDKVFG